jgi:xylulokinase
MERLAEQVEPGSRGLIFHPYLHGERAPHWDPRLRGDFIGITVEHQQKHFARAVFEGVVYSLRDCLEMLKHLGFEIDQIYLLGGGTRSPLWRQIVADVFGRPLYCVTGDATAFGAALVAGIAGKVYADITEASQLSLKAEMLEPSHEASIRYEELFTLYRIITERLKPVLHALSELYLKTNEVKRMDHGVENEN